MHDGRYRRRFLNILRVEDDMERALKPLRILYTFPADLKSISPDQKMKLSRLSNIFTEIMWCEATFTDTMCSFLSYKHAIEEDYGADIVDVRITDIVEHRIFSYFLATSSRANDIRYFTVQKTMINPKVLLTVPG